VWIPAAHFALLLVGCSPELQPVDPPCSRGKPVSYDDAPESLKTPELLDAMARYEALAGEWTVTLICPPDKPPARGLRFTIETRPLNQWKFWQICGGGEDATTTCRVSFSSPDFPELNGQSAEFDVLLLLEPGYQVCVGRALPEQGLCAPQNLDPSYNPSWDFLSLSLAVDSTNAVSGTLIYGFRPYATSQGQMTQEGYDCRWTNARRGGS
jgi:hypothetical protein